MARPKRIPDDTVLNLARDVILSRGGTVSTVEIAAHVGISQPTLFQRFGDKATLLRLALEPDPIDPSDIIGSPDEVHECGEPAHVAALTGRLFGTMLMVIERTQAANGAGVFEAATSEKMHAEGGVSALVIAISQHFETLEELRVPSDLATDTLLFLVHGAAGMALSSGDTHADAILKKLQTIAVRSLFQPN